MKILQNVLTGLLIGSVLLLANSTNAQSKISVSAGLGFLEMANVGVHYNAGNLQTGIRYGIVPTQGIKANGLTLDLAYHIAGKAKKSDRKPWYVKGSLHFMKEEDRYSADKYIYTSIKFGREFNVTEQLGFHIDIGRAIPISIKSRSNDGEKWNKEPLDFAGNMLFVLPATSVGVFYKF